MNRKGIFGISMGVILGIPVALSFAGCKGKDEAIAPTGATAPEMVPGAKANLDQQIAVAQQIVARDPKNLQAWVELGNAYFDTHQSEKAIEAYGKALELDPKNPNVLTDQGVMYRATGAYEKAVANFQRANALDPSHVKSVFNLGIVYDDMKEKEKAAKAWNRVIEMAPAGPEAFQARQALEHLKAVPAR